jgi:hypothetical protein
MRTSPLSRRALAAAGLSLALVACSSGGGDDASPKTTQARISTTTSTTAPPPPAPLTGLPQKDQAKLNRPAMIVKIDNTAKAIGVQEGLDVADLVFVEQTEQGTTRIAAVVQSRDTTVGPVRSARTSDLAIAGNLNHPLFVYSGANAGVLRSVRTSPSLVDTGIDAKGVTSVYTKNQRGGLSNLLRYFVPTADLYSARAGGSAPSALFAYRAADQASVGDVAKGVRVNYGGGAATSVLYEWNGKGWARTQNNVPHTLHGGARIEPENVVVMTTQYRLSGYRDTTGAPSPEAVLEGGGEALFLADGKVVRGRWSRPGPNARLSFTDAAGGAIFLTPGETWIELAPSGNAPALL